MKERSHAIIARPRIVLGLTAATLVGWALLVLLVTIEDMATSRYWEPWWRHPFFLPPFFPFYAVLGLPVAFAFCFAVGVPAWRIANWLGLRRRRDAAIVGTLAGAGLDCLVLANDLLGARYQAPPHYEPFTRILFSWAGVGLYIAAVGAIAGLVARWAGGVKSRDADVARLFA